MGKPRQQQSAGPGDNGALVVLCTCPNPAEAATLAGGLVRKRLAACVNVLPTVRSIYRWQDEIHDEAEALMIIKTSREAFEAMNSWLEAQHSYDVPEILALPVTQGLPAYLDWLLDETAQD